MSRLRPPWTWGGFGRPISHSRFSRVGIVTAKIAVVVVLVLILVLVLVGLVLVVLILVLILVLVPQPLSRTAVVNGVDPGGVRQASVIAEHRPDAVEQRPAADHPPPPSMPPCREMIRPIQSPGSCPNPQDRAASAGDILPATDKARLGRRLRGLRAHIGYGTARVVPAKHGVAHAVEEAALLLLLLAAGLRLQLFDAGVGALERLVHDSAVCTSAYTACGARRTPLAIARSASESRGLFSTWARRSNSSSTSCCSSGVMRLSLAFTSAAYVGYRVE